MSHGSTSPRRRAVMRRFLISALALALLIAGAVSEAGAVPGVFHPELLRSLDTLYHAEGPEAYGALDRIWILWDRGEAGHSEEALLRASSSKKIGADARAYAG